MGWTNKEYIADRLIENTDLSSLRWELKNLLYRSVSPASSCDRFLEKMKDMGQADVTDILLPLTFHCLEYGQIRAEKSFRKKCFCAE